MSTIYWINGPIIKSQDVDNFTMSEMVYVGHQKLLGEVIGIDDDFVTIQVYESTSSMKVGEPIEHTGQPLSIELGPGLLGNIYDGIGRPLQGLSEKYGSYLDVGQSMRTLSEDREWHVNFSVSKGDFVELGQIYATFEETGSIEHRLMATTAGTIVSECQDGLYKLDDTLLTLEDGTVFTLSVMWPIRHERPVARRIDAKQPLITGQRVIDTLFPIVKGGSAAIPGGFGAGKTMLQHQLAKWCDADIIVYIGCGERGNEMAQVLEEFSELIDPKTGRTLMERTILIANTSNMPVAAREASIYTGITFAEYYRDMGYHVALMADSTSRWAEALRELSGRLEEMPAEEGFPAYLASRLAAFYERSSFVDTLNGDVGSISIIGAISPQGADFSEPVTQNTQRFIGCFWALDKALAYIRHFPSINYNLSYSEYLVQLDGWYDQHIAPEFLEYRQMILSILNEETSLMEIVKLIGQDVLADRQKLTLEMGRVIRVGYLQQNAFHEYDSSVSLQKQFEMLKLINYTYQQCQLVLHDKKPMNAITNTHIFDEIVGIKYAIDEDLSKFDAYYKKVDDALASIQ
ncbi:MULTISPECIES: V-type ATP synthase subunit A [unclassified Erysipelothrix]|uniref:V-type ATP synthase subunit A n=1 Tax=unclassified Erysipelothrix TaxID=2624170 RepID=UPI00137706B8|nr:MULTISPECIES: V-type ATP synthase subunit A [unclassified Erysipelothrix]MBK2402281.1 V-type ATP synthase subunit A [Erysipelothrix sp. strain 2 (EsS2-6-Brazil)]MBK2404478.1 V-type ATP synthase subunit A [Erysipelothrix sp. strain 2 (EsS2-7-Brazil)]NBA01955.1 V-type ATP synthase subunit A [Erysipelothrix rhusiopathiae]